MRIADDRGGRIGTYIDKYQGLRTSNESVIIDGLCASACTIVLGAVSPDRICVTSRANLGFHAAWDFGARGQAVTNPEATRMLFSMYPPHIRTLDQSARRPEAAHDLPPRPAAPGMYRPCYLDAQASANKPAPQLNAAAASVDSDRGGRASPAGACPCILAARPIRMT